MADAQAEQFSDFGHVLELIQHGEPPWQALVSIGVYAAEHTQWEAGEERVTVNDLISRTIGPLETLLGSPATESRQQSLNDEQSRLLFHARLALGLVLLASGDKSRSNAMLHDMAATKLSVRGSTIRSGPGVVAYQPDLAYAKSYAALHILQEHILQEDYGEILFLMTEAAACNPGDVLMPMLSGWTLDLWATKCEKTDASQEYDFPSLEWLDLFAGASDILSVSREDASGDLPHDCERESAQFLAWEFGQLVGRFLLSVMQRGTEPFQASIEFLLGTSSGNSTYLLPPPRDRSCYPPERGEEVYRALTAALALVSECDPGRDWTRTRERYVQMWQGAYTSSEISVSEVGPESDLFWAMRIGFADKILEKGKQLVGASGLEEMLGTSLTSTGLRTVKILDLLEREAIPQLHQMRQQLPPTRETILGFLLQTLGTVWQSLPSEAVDELATAEEACQSGSRTRPATISFHNAVVACLHRWFVDPLADYMNEEGLTEVTLSLSMAGRTRYMRIGGGGSRSAIKHPTYLSLEQWSGLFRMLSDLSQATAMANLQIKTFINRRWPGTAYVNLTSLADSLSEIQTYRNHAAHPRPATTWLEEKKELDKIRSAVLGLGRPSVVGQISQLFLQNQ